MDTFSVMWGTEQTNILLVPSFPCWERVREWVGWVEWQGEVCACVCVCAGGGGGGRESQKKGEDRGPTDRPTRMMMMMMMMMMIIVSWYWQKGQTMCRLISYDIMMGQHNTTMTAVMPIRHDDAIWYSVMIACKGDENTRQMMIMIMVIIMIFTIVSNHGDDDGDHSNIARLSLIDAIDGGYW